METDEIQTALASAVEEVLETMCFTSVFDSAEGAVAPSGDESAPALLAELQFHGSHSGGFRVGAPMKLARTVGAGFLGRDEAEVSDDQAGEVVCELANMFCGSVLSRLESQTIFEISHPELAPQAHGAGFGNGGVNRWFDLGDGILSVSLEFRPTAELRPTA